LFEIFMQNWISLKIRAGFPGKNNE